MKENKLYQDKTLNCKDCRSTFVWSTGEQAFYSEKRFDMPKRCPECRAYMKRKMHAHSRQEVRNEQQ